MKTIYTAHNDTKGRMAKVKRDPNWGEYKVELWTKSLHAGWLHAKEADYHTNDKEDAIDTAKQMVK